MTSRTATGAVVMLRDGRALGYAEYGDPAGTPVIAFHGMPGSRLMMQALDGAARTAHVRLIAPERPGYGLSQPDPRGTFLGYADDITQLADALALARFSVLGASGGGPYALVCAAQLPRRVRVAGLLSGIGPLWVRRSTRAMPRVQRLLFRVGRYAPAVFGLLLARLTKASLPSMEKHVQAGTSPSPSLSPALFAIVTADQREAVRSGTRGVVFDIKNYWRPWDFPWEAIRVPVYVWHGEADTFAPPALARYIVERLARCTAVFYPEESHTDPIANHGDAILATLSEAAQRSDSQAVVASF